MQELQEFLNEAVPVFYYIVLGFSITVQIGYIIYRFLRFMKRKN